jgi:hypothetical protein
MGLFSILYVVEMKWNVILEQGLPPLHESSWKTKNRQHTPAVQEADGRTAKPYRTCAGGWTGTDQRPDGYLNYMRSKWGKAFALYPWF